ncbi:MAG TPA: glycosyl transferase family A, partial [Coleofasciculaceae cyanobacterium]
GGFDQSLTTAADWDMWLRLAAHYHFCVVPSVQILYRVSGNSMSSNIWKIETESLKVIERNFAQAHKSLQHLKRETLGNRYKYLTFKAVEGNLERKKGLTAARFLWQAVRYDPSMLRRVKIMLIVLAKITAATLLPSQQATLLLKAVKRRSG